MNLYTFDEITAYSDQREAADTAEFEVVVTDAMMQKFYEICGDQNPMHTDALYACENGYKDRLVYGMLTASFYSTLAGVYLPGKYCVLQKVESSFHRPVYIGDRLTIWGRVKDKRESVRRITVEALIRNQNGEKVSKALIYAGVIK